VLRNGEIAYQMKYPARGATHRVMTPVEFLARLAALVPCPAAPMVRHSRACRRPHVIAQHATIQKILNHLGLPVDPPTVKSGRGPTWNEDPPIWPGG
jgi:hypothetical protein